MVPDMENIPYFVIQIVVSNLFLTAVAVAAAVWYMRDCLKVPGIGQRWVLVTGCDSGFGHTLAQQLDRRGFHVIATCLTEEGSSELKDVTSSRLKTVLLNVTDGDSMNNAVAFVRKEVGEQGLWGLVNNAGRSTPIGPSDWMQLEDFKKVLDVNLIGVIDVTLRLLPLVKKAQGRVVNVASIMGRVALTGGGYCPSKSGVEAFSDSLRRNMKPFGVKVSIIEPGFFKTEVTSLDLIESDLQRLWNRLPAEAKDSYGEGYLEKYLEAQRFFMKILCSADISKVTGCMEHALTARHPRTRYSPGWDAKLLWIPLSYLPSFLADYAISALLPVAEAPERHASSP
ncbi:hypothetical protein COCON_G00193520 [Conger conger]|uniref:Uncharacterized protein n=1 Tax=Conger conger TaxID=82655 RepID=A0A9Q1D1J3_CONCO|nr:retinol dehydrogenase 1 [Conger conger]KAJ8255488.1 hypothetical protein COCON_G00193520 [Conger conger]